MALHEDIKPFEWLTSSESLGNLISELVAPGERRSALHIGCGSSTLGEFLVESMDFDRVLNVDVDQVTLTQMEQRWNRACTTRGGAKAKSKVARMQFAHVDLASSKIPCNANSFDIVLDKSTLDCTLCSDAATTGLLCETYRCLKDDGGIYLVISFHEASLLIPLLRDLPGACWEVEQRCVKREVENLLARKPAPANRAEDQNDRETSRMLNVMVCRKRPNHHGSGELDPKRTETHIHQTNNDWFQKAHPLVTWKRKSDLEAAWGESNGTKSLSECYSILFTAAEREHLTYENFLEDWDAFASGSVNDLSMEDGMNLAVALEFLQEMQ